MDLYTLVQSYVDPLVVFLCILLTEVFRRVIPCRAPDCIPEEMKKFDRKVGPIVNRFLPMIPLVFGIAIMYFLYKSNMAGQQIVVKGIVNGGVSSYLYRAYKVTILGE